ncbi:uncharacterized protein MONBRDRAFT_29045 [Monosiga brevicollis MX1]|uniref:Phosphodiester glycosidase domain-containing protein n=1 Tax=Monosiga brevicollis TaxID=81824 RepID=A9V9Y5_MONBE|nr:uncharacterized protein MONBRDRAFT_29045 [Monosiga brevicollis MX1]EDQ85638.1 predicted protein [Monosiga brevicollis MX1]|eukprot:XP_001749587.1 hypothetical protein [Monosiga brevicollis MX1]
MLLGRLLPRRQAALLAAILGICLIKAVTAGDILVQDGFTSDFDVINVHNDSSFGLTVHHRHGVFANTGRSYNASIAVAPAHLFHIGIGPNGCEHHRTVSEQAKLLTCEYATNAGFFDFTPPACEGNLITDGVSIQHPCPNQVNFGRKLGMTCPDSTQGDRIVIGYMQEADIADLTELITGRGWLIRHGQAYTNQSREFTPTDSFVSEKAPRTALGLTKDGAILSLVVDGIEEELVGPDLHEMASLLLELDVVQAINLDGGGSSTAVYQGHVFNMPHCLDTTEPICERNVTSVVCFWKS